MDEIIIFYVIMLEILLANVWPAFPDPLKIVFCFRILRNNAFIGMDILENIV